MMYICRAWRENSGPSPRTCIDACTGAVVEVRLCGEMSGKAICCAHARRTSVIMERKVHFPSQDLGWRRHAQCSVRSSSVIHSQYHSGSLVNCPTGSDSSAIYLKRNRPVGDEPPSMLSKPTRTGSVTLAFDVFKQLCVFGQTTHTGGQESPSVGGPEVQRVVRCTPAK